VELVGGGMDAIINPWLVTAFLLPVAGGSQAWKIQVFSFLHYCCGLEQ